MTLPAIRVQGLSKQYMIGAREEGYRTLRETLSDLFLEPGRRLRSVIRGQSAAPSHQPFWALRNLDMDVARGEVVGVIGRNGAGKTTLLKILSRITPPTEGTAEIRGRVGSLLEVGTGFHPELTGRENIFLNGAILGMKRAEIERKFDEIVAFAEVEQFIDTPVKRYSSGMYVRLAFAVAAHLEPEILLVDEVLAVGDAAFQRKCLGKISDVASHGRSIVFVSHNLVAVQKLCARAVWIDRGELVGEGPAKEVVSHYLSTTHAELKTRSWERPESAPGNQWVRLRKACIQILEEERDEITIRTPFALVFEFRNLVPARLNLSLHLYDEHGNLAFNTAPVTETEWHGKEFPAGLFRSACRVPGDLLNDGNYSVELLVVRDENVVLLREPDILVFKVAEDVSLRGAYHGRWPGIVRPLLEWETEMLPGNVDSTAEIPGVTRAGF